MESADVAVRKPLSVSLASARVRAATARTRADEADLESPVKLLGPCLCATE